VGLVDACFDDGDFVLLLVVVENGEAVSLDGEFYRNQEEGSFRFEWPDV
jgi:alpha-acetolactate decarboxylase